LQGLDGTTSDIVKFVGAESKNGNYTIKFVGYLDSLTEALDNITSQLEDYNVSVGNYSLRQIYFCYDNMRPWDQTTLLNWYNNEYVSGSGEIGKTDGSYIIDGISINGILGENTIESLARERDKNIEEVRAFYNARIDAITADMIAAINGAAEGGVIDPSKVHTLQNAIESHFKSRIDAEKAACAVKEEAIWKTYNDRVDSIGNPSSGDNLDLGNPDLLLYTLDITFSVNAQ
jgi:hypothetical protein